MWCLAISLIHLCSISPVIMFSSPRKSKYSPMLYNWSLISLLKEQCKIKWISDSVTIFYHNGYILTTSGSVLNNNNTIPYLNQDNTKSCILCWIIKTSMSNLKWFWKCSDHFYFFTQQFNLITPISFTHEFVSQKSFLNENFTTFT